MLAVAAAELDRTPGAIVSMAEPDVCAPIDANGNLTTNGTATLSWNSLNQLVEIVDGATEISISYNHLRQEARRVSSISSVVESDESIVWCGADLCEGRSPSAVLSRYFAHGVDETTDMLTFRDHLQSVTDVATVAGTRLLSASFEPFGRRSTTPTSSEPLLGYAGLRSYPGQQIDHALLRAYDAALGRFISEDPIGLSGGINLFGYARNNPVRFMDPMGLTACEPQQPCQKKLDPELYRACLADYFAGTLIVVGMCARAGMVWGAAGGVACLTGGAVGLISLCISCSTFCPGGPAPSCPPEVDLPPGAPPRAPGPGDRRPPSRRPR